MSIYPHGDLWPLQVRVMAAHLEREALAQGLAERQSTRAPEPPVARAPRKRLLPLQQKPRPSQRVVARRTLQHQAQRRLPVYRLLALLTALVAAALFGLVGVAILRSDLSLFATAVTLLIFGWALALTEVWALPSLYRWAYWRWLLVSWR